MITTPDPVEALYRKNFIRGNTGRVSLFEGGLCAGTSWSEIDSQDPCLDWIHDAWVIWAEKRPGEPISQDDWYQLARSIEKSRYRDRYLARKASRERFRASLRSEAYWECHDGEMLTTEEQFFLLEKAAQYFPKTMKTVFLLRGVHGASFETVSTMTGLTRDHVVRTYSEAKHRMQQVFGGQD